MAQTFTFELVSPEKVLLSGQAEQVQLPGSEGDMTILPNHAPLISTLRPGVIDVVRSEGRARIFVRQAFAQVEPDRLTVLAEKAYDVSELRGEALSAEISAAEKDLAEAKTDEQRLVANQALTALAELRA
ncbi:F0F1 ATP synthase subunit epsilon [Hyphomicrobium sp.]|uniref:F0F1 ATP synthase subunit epsilon n=1 Tax=Hyphomicrobium sp. TaxID=82 RepID=UPI002C4559C0|nr:F0F1 ATP synthase subunit epsilon [Hyphomicrobium sp.]HRN89494.1 F0F1 ATP synthase subunit epsilon [Hyphomicrobium sp.]HRQ27240.1 F0F1 ATP synthase subunit epsilon [Hyphomicrobium sp.]